jgi:hypothetical protein
VISWQLSVSLSYYFFFLVFLGGVGLSTLGTSATVWSIVSAPHDDDDYDDECGAVSEMIGKKAEVLGENLLKCLFVHHKSHITGPGLKPRPPRCKASG